MLTLTVYCSTTVPPRPKTDRTLIGSHMSVRGNHRCCSDERKGVRNRVWHRVGTYWPKHSICWRGYCPLPCLVKTRNAFFVEILTISVRKVNVIRAEIKQQTTADVEELIVAVAQVACPPFGVYGRHGDTNVVRTRSTGLCWRHTAARDACTDGKG